MADHRAALCAGVIEQTQHVGGEHVDRVLVGVVGGGGVPEAAHVGHQHPVAGGGQRSDLVAPGEAELREPVQQHDDRAARRAVLGDRQLDPVSRHRHHHATRATASTSACTSERSL